MTNREKYKQAFSVLRASDDFSLEANDMKQTAKQFRLRKAVVLAALAPRGADGGDHRI